MTSKLVSLYTQLFSSSVASLETKNNFLSRLSEGALTRDENPDTHFCVYFAGFDPVQKKVFLGHHKKSGLWLFNGGHIDKNETPEQALMRETGEEWGISLSLLRVEDTTLLTVTHITHPEKIICKIHYDIWYFVALTMESFKPKQELLHTEFYENKWLTVTEAAQLATDPNTHFALGFIGENFF